MNNKKISLILLNLLFFIKASFADPTIIEKRYEFLTRTNDTLISYYRSCSGCIPGTEISAYFFYKSGNKYIVEYYRWQADNDKLVESFKSKQKGVEIRELFNYVGKSIDSLQLYDGSFDLYDIIESKKKNDTATNGTVYSYKIDHGPIIDCRVKLGDRDLKTKLYGFADLNYYLANAPTLGKFIVMMNNIYSKYNKYKLVD